MTSTLPLYQVDAFADRPFAGNPAAVCLLSEMPDDAWMQSVAAEMNLSETAFLAPREGRYDLRWFTPLVEVALCGHATLASAHILWSEGHTTDNVITFRTQSGPLTMKRRDGFIEMDFPQKIAESCSPPPGLLESLGVSATYVGRNKLDYLIEIESEAELRAMKPDFAQLATVDVRGVIVTGQSSGEFDFVSRYFAPAAGIDEDPVTGSAYTCLGPHWQERLAKNSFRAYQASDRGGVVQITVTPDRVLLGGNAVTVMRGRLAV